MSLLNGNRQVEFVYLFFQVLFVVDDMRRAHLLRESDSLRPRRRGHYGLEAQHDSCNLGCHRSDATSTIDNQKACIFSFLDLQPFNQSLVCRDVGQRQRCRLREIKGVRLVPYAALIHQLQFCTASQLATSLLYCGSADAKYILGSVADGISRVENLVARLEKLCVWTRRNYNTCRVVAGDLVWARDTLVVVGVVIINPAADLDVNWVDGHCLDSANALSAAYISGCYIESGDLLYEKISSGGLFRIWHFPSYEFVDRSIFFDYDRFHFR